MCQKIFKQSSSTVHTKPANASKSSKQLLSLASEKGSSRSPAMWYSTIIRGFLELNRLYVTINVIMMSF